MTTDHKAAMDYDFAFEQAQKAATSVRAVFGDPAVGPGATDGLRTDALSDAPVDATVRAANALGGVAP